MSREWRALLSAVATALMCMAAYLIVLAVFGVTIIEYLAGCGMPEIGGKCVIVGG